MADDTPSRTPGGGDRTRLLGVNYHPAAQGIDYWRDFDRTRIAADLAAMSEAGFDLVRVFLFWRDVEPEHSRYDGAVLDRLAWFVEEARTHGLQVLCSVLTVWMNGQLFEPDWFEGRSLWSCEPLRRRAEALLETVATRLRGASVWAYDLGDELPHSRRAETSALSGDQVKEWWRSLAAAVRRGDPSASVIQCSDGSALAGEDAFHPAFAEALDAVGVHGFPLWSPYRLESNASQRSSRFVGFLAAWASAWGPALVDEIGCYAAADEIEAGYLGLTMPAAWYRGSEAVVVWCWQDFTTENDPYERRANERLVGLVDGNGVAKPQLAAVQEAATLWRELGEAVPAPVDAEILLPTPHRDPASYLTAGQGVADPARAAFTAHVLASQAHIGHRFATALSASPPSLLIVPCWPTMTLSLQQRLVDYVREGGTLWYSAGSVLDGFPGEELCGAELRDFALEPEGQRDVVVGDLRFRLPLPAGQRQVLRPTRTTVVARFAEGDPALLVNTLGRGAVFYSPVPLESALCAPGLVEQHPWWHFYQDAAVAAGIDLPFAALPPAVESLDLVDERGTAGALLLNHGSEQVEVTIEDRRVVLPPRAGRAWWGTAPDGRSQGAARPSRTERS